MPFWGRNKDTDQTAPETASREASGQGGTQPDRYDLRLIADGGDQPVVDIVFVHGLTGDRESTWTEKSSQVFWPGQLLPESIPDARIIGFGYDADVMHFWAQPSHNRVANHASNLVQQLGLLRRKTKTANRPIIFVAHSLGGLVCEDGLLISQISAENHIKKISEYTRGFAFLGTPHHGSDLAKWGSAFAGFTKLVRSTNKNIVQILQPDSETLARIQQDFHSTVRNRAKTGGTPIQITCFFEELEVRGVGFIVPQHSAVLPGYTAVSIHADHMGMTKFGGSTASGFKKVSEQLWLWVDDIKEEAEAVPANSFSPPGIYPKSQWPQSFAREQSSISGNISGQNLIVGNNVSAGDINWGYSGDYPQQSRLASHNPR